MKTFCSSDASTQCRTENVKISFATSISAGAFSTICMRMVAFYWHASAAPTGACTLVHTEKRTDHAHTHTLTLS